MSEQTYPTLYCRRSDGGVHEWKMERRGSEVRSHSGTQGGAAVISTWKQISGKNAGRSNATSPEEQAHKEVLAAYKKRKEMEGYKETVAEIDTPTFFAPMLAQRYQVGKDRDERNIRMVGSYLSNANPVYVQPKLDGMRCIATAAGLFSRNGKPIHSAPHIHKALLGMMRNIPAQGWMFDGELYADKFSDDFNRIISLAKKTKPTAAHLLESERHLEYHIYDMPCVNAGFAERYEELLAVQPVGCLQVVATRKAWTPEEIDNAYGEFRLAGYEGAMVRLDLPYEQKRSKSLLKYKHFDEEEFTILGIEEGEGNRAGMAGSLCFETAARRPFTAALKGTRAFFRDILARPQAFLGKTATVQFQNWTPDGSPRFPCVKAIRDYE